MSDLRQAAEQALQALEELQYAVTTTAKTDDVVLYYRAIVALRDALRWQSYPASSPSGRWEDDAWCAECGVKLEPVRPGKHQHPICSQAEDPQVRALREALEELVYWFPSGATYRRLGFDPNGPMRALEAAKAVLARRQPD